MSVFFTSDLHVGHANILKYSKRPFADLDEMHSELVRRWNSVVGPKDEVYVVGDFAYKCHPGTLRRFAESLNGTMYLVRGNHDKASVSHFAWVKDLHTIHVQDGDRVQRIVLCHYAMRVWNTSHHGTWHLYGHSHGNLKDDPNSLSFDVGVDCWDYTPVSYEQVKARMATKTWKPIDHHGRDDHE